MLCSKCFKEISAGQEIQIEGSVFCKTCVIFNRIEIEEQKREVSTRCHTCSEIIYKDELIYEISISLGAEYIVSGNETKKIIQCA